MSTKVGGMYCFSTGVRRKDHKGSPPSKLKQKSVRFLSIKPVLDESPEVQDHLRRTSIVYARTCPSSQPHLGAKLGQKQVTQLRLKDWQRYQWTWPPGPSCRRPWLPPPPTPHPGTARDAPGDLRGSLPRRESGDGRETTTSFPPLVPSLGQPMLRRPTRRMSLRTATVGDEVLDMLGNYLDLTPVTGYQVRGQGQGRRRRSRVVLSNFYTHHFPLLLEKKAFKEEDSDDSNKVVSHRQIQGRQTADQKRRAEVSRRCGSLERALTSLERGADDLEEGEHVGEGLFVTELREDAFDPRLWPWNSERYLC